MIVILTGAGISQESGIRTFRSVDGLWENERVEDVAMPQGFVRNPAKVFSFYNTLRRQLLAPGIVPNAAHMALAHLEAHSKEPVLVITQNIDNLHERAGTQALLHMHGELLKARCTGCAQISHSETDFDANSTCLHCGEQGMLRPHIVWFEEMPLHMEEISVALRVCRLFVSIGTSGHVYPAAGFASEARAHGAQLLELNLERSIGASNFHEGRYGAASQIVPAWVNDLLCSEKADAIA